MIEVNLIYDELKIEDIYQKAVSEECGAVALFIGTTRNHSDQRQVKRLIYESYEKMALLIMETVCKEIKEKWSTVNNIVIYHRLGEVPIGKASVVIAVSSPHRQESLDAVHFAIDRIKAVVPIFKKEEYENGDVQWKENKECLWSQK
ncbi:hypothetical protein PGB90_002363 [Kerria lacca]